MDKVELIGAWPSPFAYRVIWALELKSIHYDSIEEDLANKSPLLLCCNPIHKKVPVLVHNDKAICESSIILEYLEETWPHQYSLLPNEPYERALVRFWTKFADDKGITIWILFRTIGEDQEKAKEDTLNMLKTIEEHGVGNKTFFGGENIGMADLAIGSILHWLEVIEKVVQVKLFEANMFPSLYKWFHNFKEVPIIKRNLPDQGHMFTFFKKQRERIIGATPTLV